MSDGLELDTQVCCGLVMAGMSREDVLASARGAEERGFDSVWVGDHLAFHVPLLESVTLLSFVAGATERVRLGTSVYLLPLRHPVTTAKTIAALDRLSGGRLVFGVGIGGEYPPEFEAVGVPVRERGARTDEAIGVLRQLWTRDAVTHRGRYFSLGPVSLDPKPLQPGGPPVWVGGRSPAAMRRAGRLGDGFISTMTSPDRYRKNLEAIAAHAREAGRTPLPFGTAAFLFTALDDTYEKALDRAAALLGRLYNRPFRDAARKYCLLGRPADCLEQMHAFTTAGVRHFILSPLDNPTDLAEAAAAEILPNLRS